MSDNAKNLLQRGLENIQPPMSSFIRAQTTSSLILLLSTIIALWWANSSYAASYVNLVHTPVGMFFGDLEFKTSLKHLINDGLMVVFFFLLGLEIKREVLVGDLAQPENRRMLIFCALGGMMFPALIYSMFNWSLDSQVGWGIPMATVGLHCWTCHCRRYWCNTGDCDILHRANICYASVERICTYCFFGCGKLCRHTPAAFLYNH